MNSIEQARRTIRDAFASDPDFRMTYQANIAMLLHDHHGITEYGARNAAASDIIALVFGENDPWPPRTRSGKESNESQGGADDCWCCVVSRSTCAYYRRCNTPRLSVRMTSHAQRLAEIQKRCEKATGGPWYWEQQRRHGAACYLYSKTSDWSELATLECGFATSDFIAHAREDVPWLLARVRELEGKAEAWFRENARSATPTEEENALIPPGVKLSNKGCRLRYLGGKPGGRAGGCGCPDGRCWYDEGCEEHKAGRSAMPYTQWILREQE